MRKQLSQTYSLTLSALFVVIGLILPFATAHAFGIPGNVLLPMHISVYLCAFLCGPKYGFISGATTVILSSLLTGMPPMFPIMPAMLCELSCYGVFSGLFYRNLKWNIYPSLLISMVLGRVGYGLAVASLLSFNSALKIASVPAALMTGIPGIALQLVVIPPMVALLRKVLKDSCCAFSEAKDLVKKQKKSCVLVRDGKILYQANKRGIAPLIEVFESKPQLMKNAFLVDKIIGKAAAMLAVSGGVAAVHSEVMSISAKEYLEHHGITATYVFCVENIINREGNGICPIEQSVLNVDDPTEGYQCIRKRLNELQRAALRQSTKTA